MIPVDNYGTASDNAMVTLSIPNHATNIRNKCDDMLMQYLSSIPCNYSITDNPGRRGMKRLVMMCSNWKARCSSRCIYTFCFRYDWL